MSSITIGTIDSTVAFRATWVRSLPRAAFAAAEHDRPAVRVLPEPDRVGRVDAHGVDHGAAGGLERTFFMRAIVVDLYTSGPVDPALTHDHTWVTKAELPDHIVGDAAYLDFLQKLL